MDDSKQDPTPEATNAARAMRAMRKPGADQRAGKARWAKLTKRGRSQLGKRMAEARWAIREKS